MGNEAIQVTGLKQAKMWMRPVNEWASAFFGLMLAVATSSAPGHEPPASPDGWRFQLRHRVETSPGSGRFHTLSREVRWDPASTAMIVCDVWDVHHSRNAVRRVEELAPRLDLVLKKARDLGVTIIHAPSDCMPAYVDHPARKRAQQVPPAADLPADIGVWCSRIPSEASARYPIDQSDGGDDDDPAEHAAWGAELVQMGRDPGTPWKTQSPLITIDLARDFVTDDGKEVWNILRSRGIEHVVLAGVHTNMCVLGRPFGLRQLVRHGKEVVLLRDLTDTMYNPARWPCVNHHTGTDLMVEYIERHICPTISSDQILGGQPFRFSTDRRPTAVMVMAEDEYETNQTLPRFAAERLGRNFRVELVFASETAPNDLPGLEVLRSADVALISVRRRILPAGQLELFREHVRAGKPLLGIRTASHAFSPRDSVAVENGVAWPEFDAQVWGGNYSGHHGADSPATIRAAPESVSHSVMQGIESREFVSEGSLYKTSPVNASAELLLCGRVEGQPEEPVAWTMQREDGGRSFYTSLGHKSDFDHPTFVRMLFNSFFWALGRIPDEMPPQRPGLDPGVAFWDRVAIPISAEPANPGSTLSEGTAWHRCYVQIDADQQGSAVRLGIPRGAGTSVWWNGHLQQTQTGPDGGSAVEIQGEAISWGDLNLLVIGCPVDRVREIFGQAPELRIGEQRLTLGGFWQARIDSNPECSTLLLPAKFAASADVIFAVERNWPFLRSSRNVPSLRVADDLEVDLILQEPLVANPLYLNFDERGRLWVVQYRQYPWPAGLRLASRDNVWRNVYDPPFPPPPPHAADSQFRGVDRITIHADTDADGHFDEHKTFLEGLNLATAALKGRGGVFVMNPPYLLFYADRNDDDLPDSSRPQILLSGFGIEDTHSIANSLRWGPDGWIYGAQGSTVSASVVRHGPDGSPVPSEAPVHSMGQNVWRYHPEDHRYEIFAEGGGNAFGIEFDGLGRVYSGHNGGDTRGFYYVPGGYYLKNFGKHGSLSNPYAFGHYPAMRHPAVERFTHTFEIHEADALPQRYHGRLFAVAPHLHYIVCSDIMPDGSSRRTVDLGKVVAAGSQDRDDWFTPVDIQTGPDGMLYVADWYSTQANHYHSHEGLTNPDLGRVYRIRGKDEIPRKPADLRKATGLELVERYLTHPNRWYRETALRLMGDRRDPSLVEPLRKMALDATNPCALQALWGLHLSGDIDGDLVAPLLAHPQPPVRAWTVRLLADRPGASDSTASKLAALACSETNVEVRLQLACAAQRLTTRQALEILGGLMTHSEDANDILIPQRIWWALEAHADDHRRILEWLSTPDRWSGPMSVSARLAECLMRRYALRGTQEDFLMCTELLRRAPEASDRQRLLNGFGMAFEGRVAPELPLELIEQLSGVDDRFDLLLGIRRGDPAAISQARNRIHDTSRSVEERVQLVRALGETKADFHECFPVFNELLRTRPSEELVLAALMALRHYADDEVGLAILAEYSKLGPSAQETAQGILASRSNWAKQLFAALDEARLDRKRLTQDTIERLRSHRDPVVRVAVAEHFAADKRTNEALDERIQQLEQLVTQGNGKPLDGQTLFHGAATCGKCHRMFGRGGDVGPDLTPYDRANLRQILLAIVHPSAEIREGYENLTILTDDGQVVTGFKLDENAHVLLVRTPDGQRASIPKDVIEERHQNPQSVMPDGLLETLNPEQIRDLFAFLTSTTPPM